jgi:hypothetical protein
MIVSAHQPAYLPWLGYLHRIALSDRFIILDEVQFEKNSFINRNRVKGSGGGVWLTVPVNLKGHLAGSINDTTIANNSRWAIKHYKTLKQVYAKAPFFDVHDEFFRSIYQREWTKLSDLNRVLLDYLMEQFSIRTQVIYQSELNVNGYKQGLILSICRKLGAEVFLFGKLGEDYVEPEVFANEGIQIHFHDYRALAYPQLWGKFSPNLSSVDMLFNVPPDELYDRLLVDSEID